MKAGNTGDQKSDAQTATSSEGINRRSFVKSVGLGGLTAASVQAGVTALPQASQEGGGKAAGSDWPVLKTYDARHLHRIALPVGGIGTGTVSFGGRGDLRDWEIMNRPAKGFVPKKGEAGPFFVLFAEGKDFTLSRLLEGPLEFSEYEGSHGSEAPNENLPRFRRAEFETTYPFGRVRLSDPDIPLQVEIEAFNPFIPAYTEKSGIPAAVLTYRITNSSPDSVQISVCGNLPNFIGINGWETRRDWKGDSYPVGAKSNRNEYRESGLLKGIFMDSEGVDPRDEAWGTLCLSAITREAPTYRTAWSKERWGSSWLDFWDDFSSDGRLEERAPTGIDTPMGSLALENELRPGETKEFTFLLTWHFPNRYTWTPKGERYADEDRIGNYYTEVYRDAWDVAVRLAQELETLRAQTVRFTRAFCESSLPVEVKEAALFNLSTLRTQTCFRTADGRFFGWEGCADQKGCCHGSCTHVWNYEVASHHLFGEMARSMRDTEFSLATNDEGLMSFRVNLPVTRAQEFNKAAADGQLGCIMKIYLDWKLSGDDEMLRRLWPRVRKAVEFCWIEGGWDADRDGVMEGCQHNTMDVEYYGPNPQMGMWYLGALRASEKMAEYLGESDFARECRKLFENGRRWVDENLYNGEYYEHQVRPIPDRSRIAPSLLIGMGSDDFARPDYQLGEGCLVDQLVGQYFAHVAGLGYLVSSEKVKNTLRSIKKYNQRKSLHDHFNCMRSFALDGEPGLLMASYPKTRPENPFPYFTEVMTGFEYTAAVGMLYEGLIEEGLECIRDIRSRYDGLRRNPFDEAECGHHYARAMASWAAVLALTGFEYSGVGKSVTFAARFGRHFWATGDAWGTCLLKPIGEAVEIEFTVEFGELAITSFELPGHGKRTFDPVENLVSGRKLKFSL